MILLAMGVMIAMLDTDNGDDDDDDDDDDQDSVLPGVTQVSQNVACTTLAWGSHHTV